MSTVGSTPPTGARVPGGVDFHHTEGSDVISLNNRNGHRPMLTIITEGERRERDRQHRERSRPDVVPPEHQRDVEDDPWIEWFDIGSDGAP